MCSYQLYYTTFNICFSLLFGFVSLVLCFFASPFPFHPSPSHLFSLSPYLCPVLPRFPVCSFAHPWIQRFLTISRSLQRVYMYIDRLVSVCKEIDSPSHFSSLSAPSPKFVPSLSSLPTTFAAEPEPTSLPSAAPILFARSISLVSHGGSAAEGLIK